MTRPRRKVPNSVPYETVIFNFYLFLEKLFFPSFLDQQLPICRFVYNCKKTLLWYFYLLDCSRYPRHETASF